MVPEQENGCFWSSTLLAALMKVLQTTLRPETVVVLKKYPTTQCLLDSWIFDASQIVVEDLEIYFTTGVVRSKPFLNDAETCSAMFNFDVLLLEESYM